MRIVIDTHTHSVASGHAYSTLGELAEAAAAKGLEGFVLTDHGPSMPGGAHPWHFGNLRVLPSRISGVRFWKGIEANIIDHEGGIDLVESELARLDFVLAGFHEVCFASGSREENTRALLAALANPWVDAISHPGNPAFPVDLSAVVRAALKEGKALEINNSSFTIRRGSDANCLEIARLSAEAGGRLVVGSDAHFHGDVGNFSKALAVIDKAGVSENLVMNSDLAGFEAFLAERAAARSKFVLRALPASYVEVVQA
ncbi:MAG: PHP domain-containing protein [Spirochaetota bacterium]